MKSFSKIFCHRYKRGYPTEKKIQNGHEEALLRYALNHLFQLLEEGDESCFPEEAYLYPHVSEDSTTGSIVKEKTNDQLFVVLSPACDLVLRNGKSNTDHILLVEIESVNDALEGSRNKNRVESLVKNNRQYRHWLPSN